MHRSALVVSAATLMGLAGSALAAINVTPADIITWGGLSQGRAVPTPSGFTWAWNNTIVSNPQIDANGRVYFNGFVTSTPTIGTISATQGPRGLFTGTNSTDLSLFNGIYDSASLGGGVLVGQQNSTGVFSITGLSGNIWTSGSRVAFGVGTQGTGIINTGTGQNNSFFQTSTFGGSSQTIAQRNGTITLASAAGGTASGNITTDLKGLSLQNGAMNSSGTVVWNGGVAAVANTFITGTPTTAPFGNNLFTAVTDSSGVTTVIAQGGQIAAGSATGVYRNAGNGAGGFNTKINRNGQVYFDGQMLNIGTVTATNDQIGVIWTPGTGSQRVYREGQAAADATGSPNVDGQLYSGGMNVARRGFSNAGVLFTANLTGGTNLNTSGINQNDSGLWIATTSGTTRVFQRNDVAPGFTAAQNVRIGTVNNSSTGMNNNGFINAGISLQGEGITVNTSAQFDFSTPQRVVTAGRFGNDAAIIAGVAGNLQILARRGDPAPGTPGWSFDPSIGSQSVWANNNNQVIFDSDVTPYRVGDAIGVVGGLASDILSSFRVLYGWTPSTGVVPLMHQGQQIEVDPGVFKTVSQWTIFGESNGDGAGGAFNDAGQFAASVRFTDNSWAVVKLTVPAPSAGALALLGLGAMARRRRRA